MTENKDELLTKSQQKELQGLIDEIMGISQEVVDDYEINPSEMSGSITQVHSESPVLDEIDDGDYPYNTEFGDGKTLKEMDAIDRDRKRWGG